MICDECGKTLTAEEVEMNTLDDIDLYAGSIAYGGDMNTLRELNAKSKPICLHCLVLKMHRNGWLGLASKGFGKFLEQETILRGNQN